MKKLLFVVLICSLLISCGNRKSANSNQASETAQNEVSIYEVEELLKNADQLVEQTVLVKGSVTHTCKHSGKRCFIVGEDENVTIRVEAKGDIDHFSRELIGSELAVTGILKENRLTKEYIDQMEKNTNEKALADEASSESCEAELNNINQMREWMKENGKDYYSIFYLDGKSYEVL